MKIYTLIALVLSLFLTQNAQAHNEEKPFVVVIPSYNNKDWYEQNLKSVFRQKYENYRVVYIADAPTDGTEHLVKKFVEEMGQENRFTLLVNRKRSGPLGCLARAIFACDKSEIVVDLDGNDWLAHEEVLCQLNQTYQDPDVWVTYGQFSTCPGYNRGFAFEVPQEVLESNTIRKFGGATTHLKTFYAGLFQRIRKEDLLYQGKFIPKAYDLAYIIPIMEMAGTHSRYLSQVHYIYNNSYPLNDHKVSSELEVEMDRLVRSREPYEPIDPSFLEEEAIVQNHPFYQQIEDIRHPTLHDYHFLQNYLSYGRRPNLDRLEDMYSAMRAIRFIGDTPEEFPRKGMFAVNCDENDRENCILVYATFNRNYPMGLQRLITLLRNSNYKGHILFRLGGWPNVENGSLILSHVPYAFKVCFFKEAQSLGFKRALWLDTAVVPLVSMNAIFDKIENKGYFIMGCDQIIGRFCNSTAAAYFGMTHEQTYDIQSCSAGLFGVDFTQRMGTTLLDSWYRAAHDPDAFFSSRSDQNALSMILYQNNIDEYTSMDLMPHSKQEIKPNSLFWLDREFVFFR